MCDPPELLWNAIHALPGIDHDDPCPVVPRPETPLPDATRTLRRSISYASIDTVLPPNGKGVRRRITEMAANLKHKAKKKKRKQSPTQSIFKDATHDVAYDRMDTASASKRRRKATVRLPCHDAEDESTVTADDGIRGDSDAPSEQEELLILLGFDSGSLFAEPLPKEEGTPRLSPTRETSYPSMTTTAALKDVCLDIQPSESNVTIWDGLQAVHHVFKCRIFLQCTTHPFNSILIPDIHCFKMDCHTHPPISSHYPRPPVLQTFFKGAFPRWIAEKPDISLAEGIHMDRSWRTIRNTDGTWGWCKDAFVPLSSRLFEKMEYREFKLTSQVWVGENYVEGALTFGISMLLRQVDMRCGATIDSVHA